MTTSYLRRAVAVLASIAITFALFDTVASFSAPQYAGSSVQVASVPTPNVTR
jgi:hypothetical protein